MHQTFQRPLEAEALDIQPQLAPDVVAPVTRIPAPDAVFDAALCCQVLEHLPYAEFPAALAELRRVTRTGLVLSLPDATPHFDFAIALPGIRRKRVSLSPSLLGKRQRPDKLAPLGHHWEIGYRPTTLAHVKHDIRTAGWIIERTWRVPEKPWHRFFLLRR